jgi:RND family efflux transporter MFP subunit
MSFSIIRCLPPIVALTALTACTPPKPAAPPPPTKVTVSLPQSATVTNWDEYPGHIEAVEMVDLRPRVTGYLDSIHFTDGAEVKAGDLLFTIDPRPYQAELDRAQAGRQQAETHLELAKGDLRRAEGLQGTKAISEEEYDSRSKAVRDAEALLAAAQAAEASAKLNIDYTKITAPISGKIGRRLVTQGNLVQGNSGATVLAMLVSMNPMYCYFDVQEGIFLTYRNFARLNQNAESPGGGLICELALVNETGFTHRGQLDFFDNQVNPQTGTIRLRAVFDNTDRALVPGMFANLRVLAGPTEQALLVPEVAISSDQGYKFVYVVNQTNAVETRSIEVGRTYGTMRAVLKGLKPDEQVVVNGLLTLRPGAKVQAESPKN